jgi:hypothetical protein
MGRKSEHVTSPVYRGRQRYSTVIERTGTRREIRFKQWLNINEETAYIRVKVNQLYSHRIPETPREVNEIKCEKPNEEKVTKSHR